MRAMKLLLVPLCFTLIGCGGGGSTKTGGTPSKAGGTPSAQAPKLSPEEANMKATVECMTELAVVLESIKDEKSAEAAIPQMKKLMAKGEELGAQGKDLKPSPELAAKYLKDLEGGGERIGKAMEQAVKNAPGKAADLAAAMGKK